MTDAVEPQPEAPAKPAALLDEGAVVIDPSWFDKIQFKPNKGQYIFVPKNVLGDSTDA